MKEALRTAIEAALGGLLEAAGREKALQFALGGGDDYELCFTVPPKTLDEWVHPFQDCFGVSLTKVGWVAEGEGVFLQSAGGGIRPLDRGGFDHFLNEGAE